MPCYDDRFAMIIMIQIILEGSLDVIVSQVKSLFSLQSVCRKIRVIMGLTIPGGIDIAYLIEYTCLVFYRRLIRKLIDFLIVDGCIPK